MTYLSLPDRMVELLEEVRRPLAATKAAYCSRPTSHAAEPLTPAAKIKIAVDRIEACIAVDHKLTDGGASI